MVELIDNWLYLTYLENKGAAFGMLSDKPWLFTIIASLFVIAILITIVFFFGMKWLIPLFFSRDYLSSLHLRRILVLAIIPASMYYLYRNPIDAVSFKPYNTWILGFCFCMLVISFKFSFTLEHYALSYLCVSWFQGIASYVSWKRIINKNQKHGIWFCICRFSI